MLPIYHKNIVEYISFIESHRITSLKKYIAAISSTHTYTIYSHSIANAWTYGVRSLHWRTPNTPNALNILIHDVCRYNLLVYFWRAFFVVVFVIIVVFDSVCVSCGICAREWPSPNELRANEINKKKCKKSKIEYVWIEK